MLIEISSLKNMVQVLMNKVSDLESGKSKAPKDTPEYVEDEDIETADVFGTTGLSCPMDGIGLTNFIETAASGTSATETAAAKTAAETATITAITTTTKRAGPSNQKSKRKMQNVPDNSRKKLSVTPEPPTGYSKKSHQCLEPMDHAQYKLFHIH